MAVSASAFAIITEDPMSSARYDRLIPKNRITVVILVQSKIQSLEFRRDRINKEEILVDGPITTSATVVPAENPSPFSASANGTIPCSQIVIGRVNANRLIRLAKDLINGITS